MKNFICSLCLLISISSFAQDSLFISKDLTLNSYVEGTLLQPKSQPSKHLAIIIPGSGPTDRNGNQNFMKNNSLKKLAEGLAKNGIASFRYDKRVVKQIREHNLEDNTKFDDFIKDAIFTINYFKNSKEFDDITVIGHSQGSLVGMIAAQDRADKFVSIAGAGQTIDEVITFQVGKSAPMFLDDTKRVFGILKTGQTTTDFPAQLASVFNLDVQPFIMNWMQYDPKQEIKKLTIPILLINGTKDIQVTEEEAKLLKEANPNATLQIVDNMNHIMFLIDGDDLENTKSYNESTRAISEKVVEAISPFVKQ